jgi:hypothetical protein
MPNRIIDYLPLLREAIAEARSAGLEAAATDLDRSATASFTSSSEMLQEHGLAIRRFLKATQRSLPQSIKSKLQVCLLETEMASTGWRKLVAQLRRRYVRS